MSSRRILILFAHPAYERSRANRRLLEAARQVDGITINDLYEAYPDFCIDVAREQQLLLEHDAVVLQHPFYWYSSPALLKEWQDLVLEHGWAYGHEGTALAGKDMLTAITTGAGREDYQTGGHNRFTIGQLLAPFDQTAHLCGMRYLPPFVVHSVRLRSVDEAMDDVAASYTRILEALRDGRLDDAQLAGCEYINDLYGESAGSGSGAEPEASRA